MQNMAYITGAVVTQDFDANGLSATTSATTAQISINGATAASPFAVLADATGEYYFVYKNCSTWCLIRGNKNSNVISVTNIYDGKNINCIVTDDAVDIAVTLIGEVLAESINNMLAQSYIRQFSGC